MSDLDGLILVLPGDANEDVVWKRVVGGAIVREATGTGWLAACGLSHMPPQDRVTLIAPADAVALHWIAYPDMPVRQGRAAARLAALETSIGPVDGLVALSDEQDDPARPHIVAVVARADIQHWLLWAQHHGLDPDAIIPAPLILPAPETGFVRADLGQEQVLRGVDTGMSADDPLATLMIGDAPCVDGAPDWIAALDAPALNLRQGDFAKRRTQAVDRLQLGRIAMWIGFILAISLAIALIAIARHHAEVSRLDAESIALARSVLPAANDPTLIEAELDARLADRGAGAYTFTGPVAGLLTAMQANPNVALASLSRGSDGLLSAQLAAARAEDINVVLIAVQAAGFTITATSSRDPSGRTIADVTLRP